jgi:hypothetical protein
MLAWHLLPSIDGHCKHHTTPHHTTHHHTTPHHTPPHHTTPHTTTPHHTAGAGRDGRHARRAHPPAAPLGHHAVPAARDRPAHGTVREGRGGEGYCRDIVGILFRRAIYLEGYLFTLCWAVGYVVLCLILCWFMLCCVVFYVWYGMVWCGVVWYGMVWLIVILCWGDVYLCFFVSAVIYTYIYLYLYTSIYFYIFIYLHISIYFYILLYIYIPTYILIYTYIMCAGCCGAA